ncbi:MAG: hypothetical protein F6K16_34615, partial [Symploca sp. SIO2B6]|nr:hypothetical protein [Symploca sp. SIO2B6]
MTRSPTLKTLHDCLFKPISSPSPQFLSEASPQSLDTSTNAQRGWLLLSLGFALFYSLLALQQAFSGDYVVQDDARQHVFWMQRFLDSTAFPDDLIADYFQSVAPAGYRFVYHVAAWLGISPLFFHKILPVGLNLLTAGLWFRASMGLFPLPSAAFCSSIVLAQGLSLTDAIVSGTPKAFIYPLLLLFIDGAIRQQRFVAWGAIALQGLFYPQLVLISAGVLCLQLVEWKQGRLGMVSDQRDRIFSMGGLVVAFLVLLPYAIQTSAYGPTLTLEEARQLPELAMKGSRSRFFYDGEPSAYWLRGRSGLRLATIFTPVTNLLGIGLLLLPWLPKKNTLLQHLHPRIHLLPQLVLASLGCFFLSHLLLFRLHLPSRYTQHSIRVVVSLAASIVVTTLLHQLWQWGIGTWGRGTQIAAKQKQIAGMRIFAIPLFIALSGAVVFYPAWVSQFPLE